MMDLGPKNGRGNIVLIGDAAKMILPSSGQGAGTAIEDATVLANCLLNHPPSFPHGQDIEGTDLNVEGTGVETEGDPCFEVALKRYTKDRLPRYRAIAKWSKISFKLSLGRWWWERILRDYVPGWVPEPAAGAGKNGRQQEKREIRKWQEGGGGKGRWDEWGAQWLLGQRYEVQEEVKGGRE